MVKLSVLVFILVLVALSHVSAAKEAHRRKLCGRRLVSYTYELCGVKGCTSADFGNEFIAKACSLGTTEDELKTACCP